LRSLKLDPDQLMRRDRPVAFVDLVHSGETFTAKSLRRCFASSQK
jgi:hypothetical protein